MYQEPYGYAGGAIVTCTCYRNGIRTWERSFGKSASMFLMAAKRVSPFLLELLVFVFIVRALFGAKMKYHTMIMASISPALLFLLNSRVAKRSVLLSGDVYIARSERLGKRLLFGGITAVEKIIQNSVNEAWYLSGRLLEAKTMQRLIWKQIPRFVIPFPIVFNELVDAEVARHTIVYVGTLTEDRGLEVAIEALRRSLDVVPEAELVIIGLELGTYGRRLRSLVRQLGLASHVRFYGFLPLDKTKEVVSHCSAGLALYQSESHQIGFTDPIKVKLYLSCGLPVISTQHMPLAEGISKSGAGIILPINPSALATAMVRLMTDDVYWKECRIGVRRLTSELKRENLLESRFGVFAEPHQGGSHSK